MAKARKAVKNLEKLAVENPTVKTNGKTKAERIKKANEQAKATLDELSKL